MLEETCSPPRFYRESSGANHLFTSLFPCPLDCSLLLVPEVLQEMNSVGHGRGCDCQSHRAPHRCYRGGMEAKGTSYYKARSSSGRQEVCEVQGMLFGGILGRTSCSDTLRSSTLGPAGSLGFWSENPQSPRT